MHGVDLSPLWGYLNEFLGLVLTGLAGWVVVYIKAWLSAHAKFLDAQTINQLGEVVQRTETNAIAYGKQAAAKGEASVGPISTGNRIGDFAANYMVRHIPETLDKLKKSPSDVSDMILAKLPPPPSVEDTTGTTAKIDVNITGLSETAATDKLNDAQKRR